MRLIFKRGIPVNSTGLTMAWSICYSAAAEMKLKNQRNVYRQAKESVLLVLIKYPMDTLRSHVINDQEK